MRADEKELLSTLRTECRTTLRLIPRTKRRDLAHLAVFLLAVRRYTRPGEADKKRMHAIKKAWDAYSPVPMAQLATEHDDTLETRLVKHVCRLKIAYQLENSWIEAFIETMQGDMRPKKFATMEETLAYTYGSAEAVGMMVARILGLHKRYLRAASLQARAFSYIYLLRHIAEHRKEGRRYFPKSELALCKLKDVDESTVREHPHDFAVFVHAQLKLYNNWQRQAGKLLAVTPRQYRRALRVLIDTYYQTAKQIEKKPLAVYERQLEPSALRVVAAGLSHLFD